MANENAVGQKPAVNLGTVIAFGIAITLGLFALNLGRKPDRGLVGKMAPDFRFKSAEGRMQKISDLKGKTLLLNFWAGWCSPCMEEMPSLKKLEAQLSNDSFLLLALNLDGPEAAGQRLGDQPLPKNLIYDYDPEAVRNYRVNAVPVSVLVSPSGIVKSVYQGSRDWADSRFVDLIRSVH
jgi:thiol-disulfide isomerase/thioredoxin